MSKDPPDILLAIHELQAPLTLLEARLAKALNLEPGGSDYRALLRRCLEQVREMSQLVVDLLLLQKAESGEIQSEGRHVDLADLIRAVVRGFEPLADTRGLRFEVEAESPLPVWGDERELRRVLANLLDNAFKYTPPGGCVSLEGRRDEGRIELTIKDTGCGIPSEALPHVFECFYQVDRARDHEAGGVGLGLAIVRALVERRGGTIELTSTPGRGTICTLTFPWAPDR